MPEAMADNPVLQVREVVKTFPGVRALDRVSFDLAKGEVHALVGENGAGKSTLMHILGGVYAADSGSILLDGTKVTFADPHSAARHGISVVFQELSLSVNLSIAENVFANRHPVRFANMIDWRELHEQTRLLLDLFDWDVDPATPVGELPTAQQQVVEILKAIARKPRVLILDEPTSSLTTAETQLLFRNVRRLKDEGQSVIYISHHLSEVFELADRVSVLRDGKHVATDQIGEVTEDDLVRKMVGRELVDMYGSRADAIGGAGGATAPALGSGPVGPRECFRIEKAQCAGTFHDVSLSVGKGEIVGIAGLAGAGRTELGRAIFGAEQLDGGRMFLEGKPVSIRCCGDAIANRIAYLSEDRKGDGLFLDMSIRENCVAPSLGKFADRLGMMDDSAVAGFAKTAADRFGIVTPSTDQQVGLLSGGNQQKVLLAMWIGIRPRFLVADEPTRGVDVGAKSEIYSILRKLAAEGVGILLISSDLPEILGLSDRILVMRQGTVAGEFTREEATEESIIACAAGVRSAL